VGQAAKSAGLNMHDFMYELGKNKKSFINITADKLEEELSQTKRYFPMLPFLFRS
jgi:hypothetical protein